MHLRTQDLKPGDTVQLVDYGNKPNTYRRYLIVMGSMHGIPIYFLAKNPASSPWLILIQNVILSFWPNQLSLSVWEPISCD